MADEKLAGREAVFEPRPNLGLTRSARPGVGRWVVSGWGGFVFGLLLVALYLPTLYDWLKLAMASELYSYVILIPVVSGYLVWGQRGALAGPGRPSLGMAGLTCLVGLGFVAAYWVTGGVAGRLRATDALALALPSLLCFGAAGGYLWLGTEKMRRLRFPVGFLVFMVPLPHSFEYGLETALQYASAEVSHALMWLTGLPVFRQGLSFQLPGISIQVAPECSGIRSTLVLFITSVLAGHLFFRRASSQVLLAAAVIPLGILRNGVRIVTIAQLCVQIGPHMIDSAIHRRGGPVFFAVSLVPLFLLLWWLRRSEHRAGGYAKGK